MMICCESKNLRIEEIDMIYSCGYDSLIDQRLQMRRESTNDCLGLSHQFGEVE
jgi:hypothetical protein